MADNTTLPGTGDVIADEDIGGVKHQLVKVEYGAAGTATKVTPVAGLPVASSFLEVSGSASANNIDLINVDASGYRWVSVQVTTAVSGFLLFNGSNDGTNWVNIYLSRPDVVNTEPTWFANGASLWAGPLPCRYFRVRSNGWAAGTESIVANFSVDPGPVPAAVSRVVPMPGGGTGWSVSSQTALTNTKAAVKASAATLGGWCIYNPNTSAAYIQVFDIASASVTVGSTAPTYVIPVPALSTANVEITCGINHATAVTMAATTTATGSTALGTAVTATILFK